MSAPAIPTKRTLIPVQEIPRDANFKGLRIVRYQTHANARQAYEDGEYEFQHELPKRHVIEGTTLALKGAPSNYRLVATTHLTLRQFVEYVKYDPAHPPVEDYEAIEMNEAHEQTQADFKNAKLHNLGDYRHYNIEALRGERVAYNPTISGWQTAAVFDDTIFVAFDESNPLVLYGVLFLPKKPIMQADGQTQTAALFQTAASGLAIKLGALDSFVTTLEIELNVAKRAAAQSFADRNGRGSRKNKNLVARYDTASALATLRDAAVAGTVFEKRLADGRTTGTSETATTNIVDLSTMEQMLLAALSGGRFKAEHIKHYEVDTLLPYAQEFLVMLETQFSKQWPQETPTDSDPFRRLYAHGWPYCLKALALAYFETRQDELGPISDAIAASLKDAHDSPEEAKVAFLKAIDEKKGSYPLPRVNLTELKTRLTKIDWHRYTKPWVKLLGAKMDKKTGQPKKRELKDGTVVIDTKAENTAAAISAVKNKIMSPSWKELTSSVKG